MGKKVVIVDDDTSLSEIFKSALVKADYDVILAKNGGEGLRVIREQMPDLVLLDLMMPDINGTEVLKQLKADPATKAIPVAILSNFGQEATIKETLYSGAIEFIIKYQVDTSDLIKKVDLLLSTS